MRARYYGPSTGQFVSIDPLGLAGNDTNLRRYVRNAPIQLGDPRGTGGSPATGGKGGFSVNQNLAPGQSYSQISAPSIAITPSIFNDPNAPVVQTNGQTVQLANGSTITINGNLQAGDYYLPSTEQSGKGWSNEQGFTVYPDGSISPFVTTQENDEAEPPITIEPDPPYPPEPSPEPCGSCDSQDIVPADPNDLLGPTGYGSIGFIRPGGALQYTIEFSNEKTAQVPADNVTVTEQLSPNLNWITFQLGTIGFGSYVVNVPPGLTSYSTRVDATAKLGVYVDVDASLNLSTGLLTITFTSLDPNTLDTPANPLVGFLPPDTDPPNGEGYINYTIQPKAGLATGATLDAQASIVFDTNAAIATPQIVNTIDASPPTSTVTALPSTTTSSSFTVSWSGSDGAGPGINNYDVYVSDDGGAYTLWQSDTTATSATYTGLVSQNYSFYSVATDNLGLVQPTPTGPQATTTVINTRTATPTPTPTTTPPPLVTVTSLQVETIKVGKGKKAKKETVLVLNFSGALNAASADNAGAYEFAPIIKVKASGEGKNRKPATTKLGAPVAPASAVYNPSTNSVTLTPRGKLTASKPEELIVNGALVTDTLRRQIDGSDDGQTGSDYIATISGTRVTAGGLPLARIRQQPVTVSDAVDTLLASGELTLLARALRADPKARPSEQ